MTPEERAAITNGIWLCSDHAALIDRDVETYTIEYLRETKRNHENACAEALRLRSQEPTAQDDLIAVGPSLICTGRWIEFTASRWTIQLKHFLHGDFAELVGFVDEFGKSAPGTRYILVNALNDGRVLKSAPHITRNGEGYLLLCDVEDSAPRITAQSLGSTYSVSPKTNDLFLDSEGSIARVAGVDALPQLVRSCLSTQVGESPLFGDFGVRIAEYFAAFEGTPWLGRMIKLEVIRQASIPYYDSSRQKLYTPLQCVERVRSVEALAAEPKDQWLPLRLDLDVCGVGRWQHDIAICVPSAKALAEIRERTSVLSALDIHKQP